MFRKLMLFVSAFLILNSCNTKTNQYIKTADKVRKRHGKWIEEYSTNDGKLVAIGKYDHGEKVGTWKTTFNGKLFQKDRIKKNITKVKIYHQNGKIMERGQTRLDITKDLRHWYYFGDWKFYDENGKLSYIKKYTKNSTDSVSVREPDSISVRK